VNRSDAIPWWVAPGARLGAALLAAWGSTWRIEYGPGVQPIRAEIRAGRRCIFALWHARMLPLIWTHRGLGAAVLISRHRDGEIVARLVERLGYRAARGSSTRGGEAGTLEMLSLAAGGRLLAVTPDGPRGPARHAKPGVVLLASWTGLPVVPAASASSSTRVLRSWDHFRLPLPFARVVVAYGDPISVPRDLPETAVETWRQRIEAGLESVTAAVAAAVGEKA
jgi:hypothetical protein